MKVAILDDDLLFCEMLKDYLSSYHFDISIFTRYQDLRDQIDCFELLFLDIEMPDINGIQLVESLAYKHLDIIYVSSHEELIRQCFNRNVIGFVEKSHLEEIDSILHKVLQKEHLTISKDGHTFDILFKQIVFIEYTLLDITIHLNNHSKIKLPEKSLSVFSKELDRRFYKINRNIIINLDMEPLYHHGSVKIDHHEFQVSRRNQKDLKIKLLERSIYHARKF